MLLNRNLYLQWINQSNPSSSSWFLLVGWLQGWGDVGDHRGAAPWPGGSGPPPAMILFSHCIFFLGVKPLGAVNAVNKPSSGSPPHPVYAPRRKRVLSKPTRCYAPDGKHWLGNHEQKDCLAQEWEGCGGDLKLSDLCTPG